jgi:hypothetical protein
VTTSTSRADDPPAAKAPAAVKAESKAKGDAPAVSVAEQITRLQRGIAADEKQLADLNADLKNPDSEYNKAEAEFKAIDERYIAEKAEIAKKKEAGEDVGMKRLEDALAETEKARKLARERFDLAIQARLTSQEKIAAITEKVSQNRAALEKLAGPSNTAAPAVEPVPTPMPMGDEKAAAPGTPAAVPPTPTAAPGAAPSAVAAPPPAPATPAAPAAVPTAAPGIPGTQATFLGSSSAGDQARERANQEVVKAEQAAQEKQAAADQALQAAASVSDRLKATDKLIAIEQRGLATARKAAEVAVETRESRDREYDRIKDEGGLEEIQSARAKRDEAI